MAMFGLNFLGSIFGILYLAILGIGIYVLYLIINLIKKSSEALDVYIKKNKY